MAKTRKRKNANADFQKVKLKVGRKLKRDNNETKAEFKSRKIVLKEISGHSKDPITALTYHSDHISQHGKLTLLNHFNSALSPVIVKTLNKPILDSLSKFVIDHSEQVRASTYKCLKTCYNNLKQQQLSLREFTYNLKPYLDCAFTHIDQGISNDCYRFIEYLINTNEPQTHEPLMEILLRRIEVGNMQTREWQLAGKLKQLYFANQKREAVEERRKNDNLNPTMYSDLGGFLDLDEFIHYPQETIRTEYDEREVLLVPKLRFDSNVFLSLVKTTSEL